VKLARELWVVPLALLMMALIIPKGTAQSSAALYPPQGSVFTNIYLQVRGIGGELYLFWDDILVGTYQENFYEDFNGFDIYFNPPNQLPYSNLGNHTVSLQIWWKYWDGEYYYVQENFTLSFEIIEYFPCEEFISLNATYHDLLNDYNSLLADYNTLSADYNELLNDYNSVSDNYNNLLGNYSILATNFNSLNSSYYRLENDYESLDSTYSELSNIYSRLQSDCANLQEDYGLLTAYYNGLQEDYDTLIDDLNMTRNFNYILIAATMILVATTVYFAVRKPESTPTTE